MLLKQRIWKIFALQLILVSASAALAWLLRFDFTFPQSTVFLNALPLLLLLQLFFLSRFNLLHGYWRYTCMNDALDILKAVVLASVAFFAAERWMLGEKRFPVSVYFIEAIVTSVALVGVSSII